MEIGKLVAIVTGSAQGLGYAILKELLENGYKVCLTDVSEKLGKAAAKGLKEKHGDQNVVFRVCDVSQKEQYIGVCEYVLRKFGRIDLLVNNAGIMNEFNPKKTIDINLMGTIHGCEIALKYMGKDKGGNGGMVINVSSMAGLIPFEYAPVYSATKHAIVGLTRSYGKDFHYTKSEVIFCTLCPFFINTNLVQNLKKLSLEPKLDVTKREDLMDPPYVVKAVLKLIKDKKNGGVLAVTAEESFGYKYIGLGELDDFE